MHYFVTGATGFIGKRLVAKLLQRKGAVVHFLIRRESEGKVAGLREFWGVGPARAVPVFGDLTQKKLGVSADDVKALKGQIDHFFHLAAVYDLDADEESQVAVNIDGTRNTIDFAKAIGAGMKSNPGVAAKVFETMATEGINIEMISTSAIRISCVVQESQLEQAVVALHTAFGLDAA